MITIKCKRLSMTARVPTKGSLHAAGWDLYCDMPTSIVQDEVCTVGTGIAIEIPKGYVGLIRARSGMAFNYGVEVLGGVIDSDYRGEVAVALTLHGTTKKISLDMGMKIAQLVVVRQDEQALEVIENLEATERGKNGFGSTGQ